MRTHLGFIKVLTEIIICMHGLCTFMTTLADLLKQMDVDVAIVMYPESWNSRGYVNHTTLTAEQIELKRGFMQQMPDEKAALELAKKHVGHKDLGDLTVTYEEPRLDDKYDLADAQSQLPADSPFLHLVVNVPEKYVIPVTITHELGTLEKEIYVKPRVPGDASVWDATSRIGTQEQCIAELERGKQHYIAIQVSDKDRAIRLAHEIFDREGVDSIQVRDGEAWVGEATELSSGVESMGEPYLKIIQPAEEKRRKLLKRNLPGGL